MSAGMRSYAEELAARLPHVAPDLRFESVGRTTTLSLDEQFGLPARLRRKHPRIVHHLSVYAPLFGPRPFVITVHDLIHLRFPQYFKRSVGPYYSVVVRAVCARAARVIVDDDRTVGDLERFLGVPPAKVRTIPLGFDARFAGSLEAELGERPYFLYVGNHRPHKDLPTLFAAWERLPPEIAVDLYLTGDDDLPPAQTRPRRAAGEVRFLGEVDVERLARLYAGTLALVAPALCEGFGLPLLEAAAAGAPVIAATEAVPSGLVPFVERLPPRDSAALAQALAQHAGGPARSEEARRYARTQTWDRCAELTAEVYREVLAQVPRR